MYPPHPAPASTARRPPGFELDVTRALQRARGITSRGSICRLVPGSWVRSALPAGRSSSSTTARAASATGSRCALPGVAAVRVHQRSGGHPRPSSRAIRRSSAPARRTRRSAPSWDRSRCCFSTVPLTCASAACCCRRFTASACTPTAGSCAPPPSGSSTPGRSAQPFPLHASMQAITFDVILRAVFGVDDGAATARNWRRRLQPSVPATSATRSPVC